MSLMARVMLAGPESHDPEDLFASALSIIFPDDATNQHGDGDHDVLYTAPSLSQPLRLTLASAEGEDGQNLYSHFLWNSSLLLAELVESGTWRQRAGDDTAPDRDPDLGVGRFCSAADFDVAGLSVLELGAGTALPSILSARLGAARVTVTDYPSETLMANLRANIQRNVGLASLRPSSDDPRPIVTVDGHAWGELATPLAVCGHHAYDRVFVCDCLWMPWQHDNLRRSISWFLKESSESSESSSSRSPPAAWVIANFHTGREIIAAFFDDAALAAVDLAVGRIWERDCNGRERPWTASRGVEDKTERKRWLVVGILQRRRGRKEASR